MPTKRHIQIRQKGMFYQWFNPPVVFMGWNLLTKSARMNEQGLVVEIEEHWLHDDGRLVRRNITADSELTTVVDC